MDYAQFLSDFHCPALYAPDESFFYFLDAGYLNLPEYIEFFDRQDFVEELNSNPEFTEFWTIVQGQHPLKGDYFASLLNVDQPFDPIWIEYQHHLYCEHLVFEEMSKGDRTTLLAAYTEFIPNAYQIAVRGEAARLNCRVSHVRPECPLLEWNPENDEESKLAALPDSVFERVLSFVDTLDIFRMTQVCRRWKQFIHDHRSCLKRSEHAFATHVLTFTDWMDSSKTPLVSSLLRQREMFSWGLAKWCCGITDGLETLILDHPMRYPLLVSLLQSCPNLKHLRIGDIRDIGMPSDAIPLAHVHLPKLEAFTSWSLLGVYDTTQHREQLNRDILIHSQDLWHFGGTIYNDDLLAIKMQCRLSDMFSKLKILDLVRFIPSVLETLASVDNLQLRYLRLGEHDCCFDVEDDALAKERARQCFHQLLPKLSKLEMLRTSIDIVTMNDTVQLLTDLQLNLSLVVLCHLKFDLDYDEEFENPLFVVEPLDPDVLLAFRRMLVSKNPSIDLSQIQFVLHEGEALDALEAMDIGFTFLKFADDDFTFKPGVELHDPKVKERFGINF